jgi:hypothetical protein
MNGFLASVGFEDGDWERKFRLVLVLTVFNVSATLALYQLFRVFKLTKWKVMEVRDG